MRSQKSRIWFGLEPFEALALAILVVETLIVIVGSVFVALAVSN
jgi:hypothetical protein